MGGSALGDPGGREEGVALVDTRAGSTVGGSALGDTGGGSGDTGDTGIVVPAVLGTWWQGLHASYPWRGSGRCRGQRGARGPLSPLMGHLKVNKRLLFLAHFHGQQDQAPRWSP